jgi:uncharacterized protein YjbI with pentapeptide repeats
MKWPDKLETVQDKISAVGTVFEHETVDAIFDGDDFKGVAFMDCTFRNCTFRNVQMQESSFTQCKFIGCMFLGCNEINSIVMKSTFENCGWKNCRGTKKIRMESKFYNCAFSGFEDETTQWLKVTFEAVIFEKGKFFRSSFLDCILKDTSFAEIVMERVAMMKWDTAAVTFKKDCRLDTVMLHEATLDGHDWSGMDLTRTQFLNCSLRSNLFTSATLLSSGFTDCELVGAQMEKVKGQYLRFFRCNLEGSVFVGAELNGGQFTESNLDKANLSNARLSKSVIHKCSARKTRFDSVDLSESSIENNDVRGSQLTNLKLKYAKADRLIEDDDTDWTGSIKVSMMLNDDREKN